MKSLSRAVLATGLLVLLPILTVGSAAASQTGNWQLSSGPSASTVGSGASMAYDAATGQMLMFGGSANTVSGFSDQTWQWTGKGWSLLSPAASPPARTFGSMAYDPATRQLILSGGSTDSADGPALSDTWDWTGSSWIQLSPAPSAEYGASMAYDPASKELLRFGGNDGHGGTSREMFAWNGRDWSSLSPTHLPTNRWDSCLAWDAGTGQFLLYGGDGGRYGVLGDVWEWNGSDWTELTSGLPGTKPYPRYGAAMAFSAATGQMILLGGFGQGFMNDTWSWNGTGWSQLSPQESPSRRANAAYASDPTNGQIVLYGGQNGSGGVSDTWLYLAGPNTSQSTTTTATTAPRNTSTTNAIAKHQTGSTTATGTPSAAGLLSTAQHNPASQAGNVITGAATQSSGTHEQTSPVVESGGTTSPGSPLPDAIASKAALVAGGRDRSGRHHESAGFVAAGIVAAVLVASSAGAGLVLVRRGRGASV